MSKYVFEFRWWDKRDKIVTVIADNLVEAISEARIVTKCELGDRFMFENCIPLELATPTKK